MTAKIIDGRKVADDVKVRVARAAAELVSAGIRPRLVAVQVGDNPASGLYLRMQARNCRQVGIDYEVINLPADITRRDLGGRIEALNTDDSVTAMIIQMPLPPHLDARELQTLIRPAKDAEAVSPANMGKLFFDDYAIAPCTALAALALLDTVCPDLSGREVVIVSHSEIFGKPLAAMMLASRSKSPTVTVCHMATMDLKAHASRADILVVATGSAQRRWLSYRAAAAGQHPPVPHLGPLIGADYLKDGAIVIDVAINRIPHALDQAGQPVKDEQGAEQMVTVGDVDFSAALAKASAVTPVPGGVGPVTVAMLLRNVITCAELAAGRTLTCPASR